MSEGGREPEAAGGEANVGEDDRGKPGEEAEETDKDEAAVAEEGEGVSGDEGEEKVRV